MTVCDICKEQVQTRAPDSEFGEMRVQEKTMTFKKHKAEQAMLNTSFIFCAKHATEIKKFAESLCLPTKKE